MPKKIIIFLILIIGLGLMIFNFSKTEEVGADPGSEHNVWGWAWGGSPEVDLGVLRAGSGWISFNCDNEYDGGLREERCGSSNYGVHINDDGTFSGYAWSGGGEDHTGNEVLVLGWVRFDPPPEGYLANGYPEDPYYSTRVDLDTGEVSGWARACAGTASPETTCDGPPNPAAGGWDGWIKLKGTAQDGSPYGVWIDSNEDPAEFHGWAWGGGQSAESAVIGWVDFTGVKTDFVFTEPPDAPSGLPISWDDCGFKGFSVPTFSWTYSHPDDVDQKGYYIKVYNEAGNKILDHEQPALVSTSYTNSEWAKDNLDFEEKTYSWKVSVLDVNNNWSDWSATEYFQTHKHAWPWVEFDWDDPIIIEVPVEFRDLSLCYDQVFAGGDCDHASHSWTFPGVYECVPPEEDCEEDQHPVIEFLERPTDPDNIVTLIVTDSEGYFCPGEEKITVRPPLPKYWEVAPTF